MFSRLLILVASLNLFLGVISSTPHLRSQLEAISDAIPVDHHRARQAASFFLKNTKTAVHKDNKILSDALAKSQGKASKKIAEFKKSGHKMQVESSPNQREVTWGSFAVRHRPNGDCSGVITSATSRHIGTCKPDGSGSARASCHQRDEQGNVELIYHYFSNQDCSGQPDYTYNDEMYGQQCRIDAYGSTSGDLQAPSMIGMQCTGADFRNIAEKGGIGMFLYNSGDSNCEYESIGVGIQRFGACTLHVEHYDAYGNSDPYGYVNEFSKFFYMNIDTCSPERGTMDMTAFSDSSCTRPLWRGTAPILDENGHYNTCSYQPYDNYYGRMECLIPFVGNNP